MAKKLFETASRAASHDELVKIQKVHPLAECREDSNSDQPYQVWDGPDAREAQATPQGRHT